MTTDPVAVFDLTLYEGITFYMEFQLQVIDDDGNVTGDYDLTNKTLHAFFKGITNDEIELASNAGANDSGSALVVTDAVTGSFNLTITRANLLNIKDAAINALWHLEDRSGTNPVVANLLCTGTVEIKQL